MEKWYPGHMVDTRKNLREMARPVDVIVEVIDARLPVTGKDGWLDKTLPGEKHWLFLNKEDLADELATLRWLEHYRNIHKYVFAGQATDRESVEKLRRGILAAAVVTTGRPGRTRKVRVMVAGLPNVGKSTLLNTLVGRHSLRTGARPGITRGKQWVKIDRSLEVLDMPGILSPGSARDEESWKLAVAGILPDKVADLGEVVARLLKFLAAVQPDCLMERYGLGSIRMETGQLLAEIGRRRGCLVLGGNVDLDRVTQVVLTDFRSGKLGRVTLDGSPGEGPECL